MLLQGINLWLVLTVTSAVAMERNKIYMRRAEMQDQTAAESGYVYTSDSIVPSSYVSVADVREHLPHLGNPPITVGVHNLQLYNPKYILENKDKIEEVGEGFEESKYSRSGESGLKNYNNFKEFAKGSKGKYGSEFHEGYGQENGGKKLADQSEAQHISAYGAQGNVVGGEKFSKASHKKKGEQTSGYHKIYHKDEFKKDHTFYDESDHRGKFHKYSTGNKENSAQNGGYQNGDRSNSGNQGKQFSRQGFYDKGHNVQNDAAYKSQQGTSNYHQNQEDYDKSGGRKAQKTFNYSEGKSD